MDVIFCLEKTIPIQAMRLPVSTATRHKIYVTGDLKALLFPFKSQENLDRIGLENGQR
jgi:hypothetical protein